MRKRKTKNPCGGCGMNPELCFCSEIVPLDTQTRLSLILHYREQKRTTNTGQIAVRALKNSDLWIRGNDDIPFSPSKVLDERFTQLFLFPHNDAQPLTPTYIQQCSQPIQLIVPDGNWRQASKVSRRHPEFSKLPKVCLPKTDSPTFSIRRESNNEGRSTLWAIAEAFSLIEGKEVGDHLKRLDQIKAERTLKSRGTKGTRS